MIDEVRFRQVMGHFASGVTVVTTVAEGRLAGVIPRVTLLAALGPGPNATEEITVLPAPVPPAEIDAVLAADAPSSNGVAPDEGSAPDLEEVR